MAWIRVINEDEASAELEKVYDNLKDKRGEVSNIMKVHSLNPRALTNHLDLYLSLMYGRTGLKRVERELIAIVVSVANNCEYCEVHHAEAVNFYWKDIERVRKLIKDFRAVDLPKKTQRMLEYAVKLTKSPNTITEADIANLRECGFSDEDILNINLITSYFNFVNRITLGLGVEFTPEEVQGYKYEK